MPYLHHGEVFDTLEEIAETLAVGEEHFAYIEEIQVVKGHVVYLTKTEEIDGNPKAVAKIVPRESLRKAEQ